MSEYDTLTEEEKVIFNKGRNRGFDMLKEIISTVHSNNPSCTTVKIQDIYTTIKLLRDKK